MRFMKQGEVLPSNCETAGPGLYPWCQAPQSPSDCGSSCGYDDTQPSQGASEGKRVHFCCIPRSRPPTDI